MAEVASAYVSLIPSARGFGKAIDGQISGDIDRSGRSSGRRFGLGMAKGLAVAAVAGTTALAGLGAAGVAAGVKTAAANEQAQIAFTTMLGSAKKAGAFLTNLQKFAAETPFEFPELQTAASSLISAGVNANKVIPIMRTLGDVTSGMGTGSEGVKRATIALQQMNAAGRITGEDLNQLRDAGIPVYDLLAKATGKSKAEVVKLAQAGKLGSKELGQMMKALETGKGLERFSGLMDKQSQSLTGLWSTFKDTLNMGMAKAIQPLIPLLKQGLGGASTFLTGVLPKVSAALAVVIPKVVNFGKAFYYLFADGADGAQSFAELIDNIFGNSGKLVGPLRVAAQLVKDVINGIRASFAAFGNGDVTSNGIVGVFERIGVFARNAIPVVQQFVSGTLLPLFQQAASFIMTRVVPAFMGVVNAVRGFLSVALPIVQQFVAGMQARIAPLMPQIRTVFATIGQIIVGVMGLIQAVIQRATQVIGFIWSRWGSNIMSFLAKVFGSVIQIVGGALNIVAGIIKTVTSLIRGDWSGAWAGVKQILSGAWQAIKGIVGGALNIVKGLLSAAWALIKAGASAAWSGIKSAISSALSGIVSSVRRIGSEIVNGLVGGIRAGVGAVADAARELASHIPGPIKKLLGIASPSKVTKAFGAYVAQGLAVGMLGSVKQVQAASRKLAANISGPLERRVSDEVRALNRLASQRESVAKRLKAAQGSLASAVKVRDDYAASVRQSFESFGRVTDAGSSPDQILANLRNNLATAKAFAANLVQLQRLGLSKAAYKQIVDAGVEQGSKTAAALVQGGKGVVGQVNSLVGQIGSAGNSVASTASKALYQAGVDAAAGLVRGLTSQSKALAQAAKKIASSLVSQVKKSLGIHSPSRVFANEVGQYIPAGIGMGIDKATPALNRQVRSLGQPFGVTGPAGGGGRDGFSNHQMQLLTMALERANLQPTISVGTADRAMGGLLR